MPVAIETINLGKKYPVLKSYRDVFLRPFKKKEVSALDNVTIQVNKGEIFGLLGPNGAGKTTLLKILSTLVLPGSGDAFVAGFNVKKDGRQIRKSIGYVISEERSFYWRLTGRQNLIFFAKLNNIPSSEAEQQIKRLLDFMDLEDNADKMFKDYSTGMRQKLAIARGLLTEPKIIFMDESTNGLDPVSSHNLKLLIKEKLVEKEGKTVLFATHNLQDAEELCSRLAIIQNGRVKLTGTMDEIRVQFSAGKKYTLILKNGSSDLLQRIQQMNPINKIIPLSNKSSDSVHIDVEVNENGDSINRLIKEIISSGGELLSLHEKEPSLGELFPKIVDKK